MAYRTIVAAAALGAMAYAAPAPAPTAAPVMARAGLITNEQQLNSTLSAMSKAAATDFPAAFTNMLSAIQPSAAPTNAQQAVATMSALSNSRQNDFYGMAADLVLSGMTGGTPFADFGDISNFGACNGNNFTNPPPKSVIYPKKAANDAPYDVSEKDLRSAIYIPSSFTYGKVQPVIFVSGTGDESCETFANNLGKLFTGSSYADPVYLNTPMNNLMDAQTNSEFVAYAINYISSLTSSNVAVVTWSQGSINTQWAFKYWPSTRAPVNDLICISPDFHGTIEVPLICPPGSPCAPAVLQQNYNSNFITQLRKNGGDSAYVPTTEIHSIFDEIVEPQQDPFPGASGHINSNTGSAATNVQIQDTCPPGTPAGGPNFGHESSLYNPVTFVVTKDALTNKGPANVARSGASGQCQNFEAQGLNLGDAFATEAIIPLAGFNIETYPSKVTAEPPIKAYATY